MHVSMYSIFLTVIYVQININKMNKCCKSIDYRLFMLTIALTYYNIHNFVKCYQDITYHIYQEVLLSSRSNCIMSELRNDIHNVNVIYIYIQLYSCIIFLHIQCSLF